MWVVVASILLPLGSIGLSWYAIRRTKQIKVRFDNLERETNNINDTLCQAGEPPRKSKTKTFWGDD